MNVTPTNPFHIARAYAVQAPNQIRAHTPVQPTAPVHRHNTTDAKQPNNIQRLVGALVPGRIDFTDSGPVHNARNESLPLYRHPADLNAAATNIHAGRSLDIQA